jgi:hypothetical protein
MGHAKLKISLDKMESPIERVAYLSELDIVKNYLKNKKILNDFLNKSSDFDKLIILSIIAVGQASIVFAGLDSEKQLKSLVESLTPAEKFFFQLGGLVAYHEMVLELLTNPSTPFESHYEKPPGFDFSQISKSVNDAIRWGIERMPQMGEIYPVGGAGDRLNLMDEQTGDHLPSALLPFLGKSLLEGLFRDLEGREYLYKKLFGKEVKIPVAMMTSFEKDNHARIFHLLENNHWFGRPKGSIFLFPQPLVPVLTQSGQWSMKGPLSVNFKPGGHGVIWKLAKDEGVFSWFESQGKFEGIVRQINNPLAGTDYGLLALYGVGSQGQKAFGFQTCQRLVHASEGMNVLIEKREEKGYSYVISNIEYTDFKAHGIQDRPEKMGSPFSKFPANTNILFVNFKAVAAASRDNPLPGKLLNFKTKETFIEPDGTVKSVLSGRLESTMQNIADSFADHFERPHEGQKMLPLRTFVTYNDREKTISVTKKLYKKEGELEETPEGAYFQLLQNHRQLLQKYCQFDVPEIGDKNIYLETGPDMIFLFHPSLGPLWSVIAQKIQGGKLFCGSEMQLEIAEVEIKDLSLQGSLLIRGDIQSSKVVLSNVRVKNKGIDRSEQNCFWKNQIQRKESLKIYLAKESEFFASDVTVIGDWDLHVPEGYRMTAVQVEGHAKFNLEKIQEPLACWSYHFDEEQQIVIEKTPQM